MNRKERHHQIETAGIGQGWIPLVKSLDKKLSKVARNYTIEQVKQKFGLLRYYYSIPRKGWLSYGRFTSWNIGKVYNRHINHKIAAMNALVVKYESKALFVCENCGAQTNGNIGNKQTGWRKATCKSCSA